MIDNQKELLEEIIQNNNEFLIILLDACRYDYFDELWDGQVKQVKSLGESTVQWVQNTFTRNYYDFVYLSANPYINSKDVRISAVKNDKFREVVDLWDFGWDEEYNTVKPSTIVDEIRKRLNDIDKILAHFMQPHYPYISTKGGQNWNNTRDKLIETKSRKQKEMDIDIKKAYRENLELVLNKVKPFITDMNRKVVITSDHSEYFDEKNQKALHSPSLDVDLTQVPWVTIND